MYFSAGIMKFTSKMVWYLQIFFIFELFSYVSAESDIIVERWVNASDVIKKIPFTTMTSCYMDCSRTRGCKTIGFDENPEKLRNAYCKQSRTVGVSNKRSSNLKHMFLLLKISDLQENTSKTCNTSGRSKTSSNQNEDIWKRINIIDKQMTIKRKNKITTLDKLTQQYVIYLEFKPTTYDIASKYANVLLFTQKVPIWTYGSRLPLIFYGKQNKGHFMINTAVNGQWNYGMTTREAYPVNTWILVKISQLKQNGIYNCSLSVNNKLIHSVINNKPESFDNVQVFVADDENPSQPGYVRKLWVDVESL